MYVYIRDKFDNFNCGISLYYFIFIENKYYRMLLNRKFSFMYEYINILRYSVMFLKS